MLQVFMPYWVKIELEVRYPKDCYVSSSFFSFKATEMEDPKCPSIDNFAPR